MTVETALWITGAALIPAIGWAIVVHTRLVRIEESSNTLVEMHRNPDDHGFGTRTTNRMIEDNTRNTSQIIEDNTRAIHALTHYIKWLATAQSPNDPPPPPPI